MKACKSRYQNTPKISTQAKLFMKLLKNTVIYKMTMLTFLFGFAVPAVAVKDTTATIYGSSFYPSDYIPEMLIYARNIETGKTYSVKVPEEAYEYKMSLPAPATYIFFSWTTDKTDSEGAVLSECDGSSVAICDEYDFSKHFAKPVILKSGQVIKDLKVSNYYYPSAKTHLFVPKP